MQILRFISVLVILAMVAENAQALSWGDADRQPSEWYKSDEAKQIADNVLLYQAENGGWEKGRNKLKALSESEREAIAARKSRMRTTIDNRATYLEIRFLARIYEATRKEEYKTGAIRGMEYLLRAQYPNGGWPQYYPLRDGYWSDITFNDYAMTNVLELMRDIARGKEPFGFVEETVRAKCEEAVKKGIRCILKAQVVVDGVKPVWAPQYDPDTLTPSKARKYEPACLSGGGESTDVVLFLMSLDKPGPEVIDAVESAITWFQKTVIKNKKAIRVRDANLPKGWDLEVVDDPNAKPMWARFYEIETNRPIFGDRDGSIHYDIRDVSYERRTGYGWFRTSPHTAIVRYREEWQPKWTPGRSVMDESY